MKKITIATAISLLLLTLVGTLLLLRLSLTPSSEVLSSSAANPLPMSNGGGASFTQRLKGGWRALRTMAKKKSDGLLNRIWLRKQQQGMPWTGSNNGVDDEYALASSSSMPMDDASAVEGMQQQDEIILASSQAAASLPTPSATINQLITVRRANKHAIMSEVAGAAVEGMDPSSSVSAAPSTAAFNRMALRPHPHRRELPVTPIDLLQPGDVASKQSKSIGNLFNLMAPHCDTTPVSDDKALKNVLDHVKNPIAPTSSTTAVTPALIPPVPGDDSPFKNLIIATRFWAEDATDLDRLKTFILNSLPYTPELLIALRVDKDKADTISFVQGLGLGKRVRVVPILHWLGVSVALNTLLLLTAESHPTVERLLFLSVEVRLTTQQLTALVGEFDLDPRTLFIGPVLDGHVFEETKHMEKDAEGNELPMHEQGHLIDGSNSPWNTAGLWHIPSLLRTGFLTLSDGLGPKSTYDYGQEEVPTVALLQSMGWQSQEKKRVLQARFREAKMSGNEAATLAAHMALQKSKQAGLAHEMRSLVKLLHVGEVEWYHQFSAPTPIAPVAVAGTASGIAAGATGAPASISETRNQWHRKKMQSKRSRAAKHLRNLPAANQGRVIHAIARKRYEWNDLASRSQSHVEQQPQAHPVEQQSLFKSEVVAATPAVEAAHIQEATSQHAPESVALLSSPASAPALATPALLSVPSPRKRVATPDVAAAPTSETTAAASIPAPAAAAVAVDGAVSNAAPIVPRAAASDVAVGAHPIPVPKRFLKKRQTHANMKENARSASHASAAAEHIQVKVKRAIPIGRRRT